jgi:hypothetical protein
MYDVFEALRELDTPKASLPGMWWRVLLEGRSL